MSLRSQCQLHNSGLGLWRILFHPRRRKEEDGPWAVYRRDHIPCVPNANYTQ